MDAVLALFTAGDGCASDSVVIKWRVFFFPLLMILYSRMCDSCLFVVVAVQSSFFFTFFLYSTRVFLLDNWLPPTPGFILIVFVFLSVLLKDFKCLELSVQHRKKRKKKADFFKRCHLLLVTYFPFKRAYALFFSSSLLLS